MHSDKPTGTSVRQVLRVVPFAIFRRYSFPLSSTKDANKVTRTSSNHLECEKKKRKKTPLIHGQTVDVFTVQTVVGNPNSAAAGSENFSRRPLVIPDYWLYLSSPADEQQQ